MKQPSFSWLAAAAALLALASTGLQAQPVYRSVGSDGRVTFSDQPPPPSAAGKASVAGATTGAAAGNGALPFELRQVAGRYPVTLYTGTNCAPCGAGRALLTSRGVPFTERTVTSAEDGAALQRLSGDTTLPFVTIGSQQIKGYSDVEWTQFLDAAGYPKTSQLPASYRPPAAAPLVAVQKPTASEASAQRTEGGPGTTVVNRRFPPASAQPAPPAPSADNPAGIRF